MSKPAGDSLTFHPEFDAWWPDYDHAPAKCFSFVQKGLPNMDLAIRLAARREVCLQAGAHAGFWPRRLAEHFGRVIAFEPCRALCEAARRNLAYWGTAGVELAEAGLGRRSGPGLLQRFSSAGSSRCDTGAGDPIRMVAIDDLQLDRLDAIFLDIEGYEVEALAGAAATIDRFRPVLHVEWLPRSKAAIEAHMAGIGYKLRGKAGLDAIYTA